MTAGRKNVETKKDWNTPPKYVEVINEFFNNDIDLDPCSNEYSLINAKNKILLPIDGLKIDWNYKNIFINPPYGRVEFNKTSIYNWIKKSYETNEKHNSEILLLIPVATNTKHFKECIFKKFNGICFLEDTRLKFYNNGFEDKKGSPMACCVVYIGCDYEKFNKVFNKYGKTFKIN